MNTSQLIDRYCQVWSEPDAGCRAELLSSVWATGATYTDPTVHIANAEELLAHIDMIRTSRPGAKVLRTSQIDEHHGVARFAWHATQADGTVFLDGLDLALITPDGTKIERIIGFFGPLPQAAQ